MFVILDFYTHKMKILSSITIYVFNIETRITCRAYFVVVL
jgi:hypothetical protein